MTVKAILSSQRASRFSFTTSNSRMTPNDVSPVRRSAQQVQSKRVILLPFPCAQRPEPCAPHAMQKLQFPSSQLKADRYCAACAFSRKNLQCQLKCGHLKYNIKYRPEFSIWKAYLCAHMRARLIFCLTSIV